ncbi:hypothetical protein P43SY_007713 [Pythium insidiosum]|uniref:protein-tyrosine-phosphatase n=1 Tax=Pythium insidiosum TaxID=114742 RepID=A0AAD5LLM5_PYTIN|nr:hypothetical protein P43SY_007713 [Pythium insidiosum]
MATAEPMRYACKHCRRVLFTSDDLMEHEPERHSIAARRKLKDAKTTAHHSGMLFVDGCSSWFLTDVLPWMDEDAMAEGKLHCPNEKCLSRVGAFSWSGSQCSCGTWVTPSIKITKSRVDPILASDAIPIVATPVIAVPPPLPSQEHDEQAREEENEPPLDGEAATATEGGEQHSEQ